MNNSSLLWEKPVLICCEIETTELGPATDTNADAHGCDIMS